jgi:hypothetical protein
MPIDSIVITYRDYLLIGVIALSLVAAIVSMVVVAHQLFVERGLLRKEAEVRNAAKSSADHSTAAENFAHLVDGQRLHRVAVAGRGSRPQ